MTDRVYSEAFWIWEIQRPHLEIFSYNMSEDFFCDGTVYVICTNWV